jgi:hypothetical protein
MLIVTGPVKSISPAHICIYVKHNLISFVSYLVLVHKGKPTPLVLIQQIVVEAQDTEAAGPQTCAAPLPLQQYGEPELHRFWAMGF